MPPIPRRPAAPPRGWRARATKAEWWISSRCSMPSARSSPPRTDSRSRAPMRPRAWSPSTKLWAVRGRWRPYRTMSAKPVAKPLIYRPPPRAKARASAEHPAARVSQAEPPALSLKIESPMPAARSRPRRGKLPGLLPQQVFRAPPDMNATVALLEPAVEPLPCAEELTRINESLQARERLRLATARASRLLLEAPDVRGAIPRVLGLIGEAAHVDRVNLVQTRTGPNGEPLLALMSEWTAEGVTPSLSETSPCTYDERNFSAVCAELRAGRSVCFSKGEISTGKAFSAIT